MDPPPASDSESYVNYGGLPTDGEVLVCELGLQPEGGWDQGEQSQNGQHRGRRVSGPWVRRVSRFSAAGVLTSHDCLLPPAPSGQNDHAEARGEQDEGSGFGNWVSHYSRVKVHRNSTSIRPSP